MVQKQSHRTTTSDRGCGAARSVSAYRSGSLRRCALYRATMVSTCSGSKAESCRLERSFLGSPSNATYEGFPRAGGVDHPSSAEGPQPAGRVWRCGHSTRNGNPRDRAVALDFHDRPDSAASWCPGWPPTSSSSIAATRLVSSRGCSGKGRIGQFRHDRRSGNSWWAPCGRFDGNIAAWRSARNLDRPGRQRQDGGERPGGTLAFGRASRLRAVRQRQSVSRSSAVRRHRGTRDPVVLEPGRNACLCAAERDRFSGGHRELQRPVASQGLVAIHTRFDPRPEPAIGQVHRGGAKRSSARIEASPRRRPFPKHWRLDLQRAPRGMIVFLRRTDNHGRASLLGHAFAVDRHWLHRLVRVEVNLDDNTIRFSALRRREPTDQPLLNKVSYTLPKRPFQE